MLLYSYITRRWISGCSDGMEWASHTQGRVGGCEEEICRKEGEGNKKTDPSKRSSGVPNSHGTLLFSSSLHAAFIDPGR